MSKINWETSQHHPGDWGTDRFRRPKGPIWKYGDPAATYMVQFRCGNQTVNQLGYTANPDDADLIEYAQYHHARDIEVRRYVGYPVYWVKDRALRIEQTDWL